MNAVAIARGVARVLLGLVFLMAGASGFYLIEHPPPMPPGDAGAFTVIFFRTKYVLFVDSFEAISGVLLLFDRYVPLALTILAGIFTNIFIFHITMSPAGIVPGLVLFELWFAVAWPYRSLFAFLVKAKA